VPVSLTVCQGCADHDENVGYKFSKIQTEPN